MGSSVYRKESMFGKDHIGYTLGGALCVVGGALVGYEVGDYLATGDALNWELPAGLSVGGMALIGMQNVRNDNPLETPLSGGLALFLGSTTLVGLASLGVLSSPYS